MIADFGNLPLGEMVQKISLQKGDLSVSILTLGSILQDVRLAGYPHSLTLGSNELAAYLGPMAYYGAIVGPVANRIAGARANIAGDIHTFDANEGPSTLHSGANGTHAQIWTVGDIQDDAVELHLDLKDGLGGFPGNRRISARFALSPPAALTMTVHAISDTVTLMNLANHSYWNLSGQVGLNGHKLQIAADKYLPVDEAKIPTGIATVQGTAFDFRTPQSVPCASTEIDHTFCLSDQRTNLRQVAVLQSENGLSLHFDTTEPGVQIYDAANNDTRPYLGHQGFAYGPHAGLAIEAQGWPDAPNQPAFPSVMLDAGASYEQMTRWRFSQV